MVEINIPKIPKGKKIEENYLTEKSILTPLKDLWFTIKEASTLAGCRDKTIRRAIDKDKIIFKIEKNRYFVSFKSLLKLIHQNTKLKNKFYNQGLGQFIKKWKY